MKVYSFKANKETFYLMYLHAINGTLKLSDKECIILAEFLKYNEEYKKDPEIIFSAPIRKKIQNTLKISAANLNNYIQYLKNKSVITEQDNSLKINDKILPVIKNSQCIVSFKFDII